MYDLCIVGAGMVGSSAAKYAMQCRVPGRSGRPKVALIGPAEPKDRTTTDIFGGYYDEGRITRIADGNSAKTILSKHSVNKYLDIERESGISFYKECGYLLFPGESAVEDAIKNALDSGSRMQKLSHDKVKKLFPYFNIPDTQAVALEPKIAGYINPRRLVQAQQKLARKLDCEIIQDIVNSVDEVNDEQLGLCCKLQLASGRLLLCRKVLLATGAFTYCRRLLPKHISPDLRNLTALVVKGEVDELDLPRLKNMPPFYGLLTTVDSTFYGMPPIKYPDGKYYVKFGFADTNKYKEDLLTPNQLAQWFRHGTPTHQQEAELLKKVLQQVLPDIHFKSFKFDVCSSVHTPTDLLYIDMVTPCIGISAGGCGNAAKFCDEAGRLAASLLVEGKWASEIPREKFKCLYKERLSRL